MKRSPRQIFDKAAGNFWEAVGDMQGVVRYCPEVLSKRERDTIAALHKSVRVLNREYAKGSPASA